MANVYAVKSGNWSDVTVWNTGALPTSADDVYSNTFTVLIDVSPTVLSIRNDSAAGITLGGRFTISANGITLTANVVFSVATFLTVSVPLNNQATLVGNISGNSSNSSQPCVLFNSSGTFNIIGNIFGSGTQSPVQTLRNGSSGTINITGDVTGAGQNGNLTVINSSTGTINITGNCTGGSASGTDAVTNSSTGSVNITGACNGGTNSTGAINSSTGNLTHVGTVQASTTASGIGAGSNTQITILTGPFLTSTQGINPVVAARWFWANSNVTPTYYQIRTTNLATIRPLYTADSVGGNPATSNVRSGTVYGPAGELTGTCAVPPAGSVALGVPVDNTTGTAAISAASIRSALGLASANLDTQLAAIPTTAPPTASAIATAVNSALDRTGFSLTSAERQAIATTVEQSILNENDGQAILNAIVGAIGNQNIDQVALVAAIRADLERTGGTLATRSTLTAAQMRTELAPELANLDATVSSRSTYAGTDTAGTTTLLGRLTTTRAANLDNLTQAPPTAAAIATAVWSAATRTLTTAIDNSATIAAAVWNSLTGSYNTNGTFGKQVLIGSTAQREVAITGSHHVAADIHELQPAVIDASHFATGALDSVRTSIGLASANLDAQLNALPTAAENATATRSELAPELARAANVATTQEVGDLIEEALQ